MSANKFTGIVISGRPVSTKDGNQAGIDLPKPKPDDTDNQESPGENEEETNK